MRAISIWQPWASLIAGGHKTIETRHWPTNERGTIAIHASKKWTQSLALFTMRRCARQLESMGYDVPDEQFPLKDPRSRFLPLGAIVATAELVDCRHVEVIDPSDQEIEYGDFAFGRYGWILENVRPLPRPVEVKGFQGFWNWEPQPGELPDGT